jgi:DNA (cytosine-5)-methyltransferase 1
VAGRPRLLDLFCGAGGAAMGYHRAGFDVLGVDINAQPHYPFDFRQGDAMSFPLDGFDVIHASPPCQAYASLAARDGRHPDLIGRLRLRLEESGLPMIIENIEGAPLRPDVRLCGSMFGLAVRRHRLFESNRFLWRQHCQHRSQRAIRAYYGKKGWLVWTPAGAQVQRAGRKPLLRGSVALAPADMGIDWMTWDELREAIPPAYTEWIGTQLLTMLRHKEMA